MIHRGHVRGKASTGNTLAFGDYGLQALEPAEVSAREIEAARRAIVHYLRRGVVLWIRVFPDKPLTKKPAETRMGKGKGAPEFWVAVVKPGRIMFELEGISRTAAQEAMKLGASKLPVRTRFVERHELGRE